MNQTPTVGETLAEDIAELLERGLTIGHAHRDYCGMGLSFHAGRYIYGEVHDGRIADIEDRPGPAGGPAPRRLEFDHRQAFVAWLTAQSDGSLHPWPDNNQPLTIDRLAQIAARYRKFPRRWDGHTSG